MGGRGSVADLAAAVENPAGTAGKVRQAPQVGNLGRFLRGVVRAEVIRTAVDNARGRLLTLGAGLFAAGALVFTVSRRTLELTEHGQVTDRYTKAIKQLGSKNLTVRTGGIYALERVARDSSRDQFTVIEVLAAFIRDHSREQRPLPESGASAVPVRTTRLDLQAAVTVIGRRNTAIRQRVNLAGADLTGANLTGANLIPIHVSSAGLLRVSRFVWDGCGWVRSAVVSTGMPR